MSSRVNVWALAFVLAALLAGCATSPSVPLTHEVRASLKTIHVDRNVSKPKTIYWRGTAQAWGAALGGLVGALATHNGGLSDAERMVTFMDQEQIDISQIVYAQLVQQMVGLNMFQMADASQADATLVLSVDMYGFNKTHPFGSNMNPLIGVTGKLVRPNHEVVWQESEYVSDLASENDQGQSLETYYKEPEKLRAALAKASAVAIKRVLAKLQ